MPESPSTATTPAEILSSENLAAHGGLSNGEHGPVRRHQLPTNTQHPCFMAMYLFYDKIKARLFQVFLVVYHVYLAVVITRSWTAEQNWCTDPKFMTIVTVVFHVTTLSFTLSSIWSRMRQGPLRRLESSIVYVKEASVHRLLWFIALTCIAMLIVVSSNPHVKHLVSMLGMVTIILICYMFSYNRKKIPWNVVLWGILLQFLLGGTIIRLGVGRAVFVCIGSKIKQMMNYSAFGGEFTFGFLSTGVLEGGIRFHSPIFTFQVAPMAVYFSFLLSVAVYYGCARSIIYYVALGLHWTTGATASDTLCAATNIFIAQADIPWILQPYINEMTLSEIHTAMASGFGSMSAPTFVMLLSFHVEPLHLMVASLISAPAVLVTSKMLFPEMETPVTKFDPFLKIRRSEHNVLEATFGSVRNMLKVLFALAANLIASIAFLEFLNAILRNVTTQLGWRAVDVQWIIARLFIPISMMMGIPLDECERVARLIGVKTYVNEILALSELKELADSGFLTKRTQLIATYALCGFSNVGSIGIQLAAWSTLCTRRLPELSALSIRALVAGILCDFMTGCVAGALIHGDDEGSPSPAFLASKLLFLLTFVGTGKCTGPRSI
ncbi:solute carrier family 28 member 3-like [Ornithodoros turicata]|uniref:solute carrier family 28 member 3-like n=1 Tax=Ornithodoros turicata TaxID=34597 RepID=UPI00313A2029